MYLQIDVFYLLMAMHKPVVHALYFKFVCMNIGFCLYLGSTLVQGALAMHYVAL